jgi:hypothetical protein
MENKSIFTVLAEAVGTVNQNVVDLFALVDEQAKKIDEIHSALFASTNDIKPANDGGEA